MHLLYFLKSAIIFTIVVERLKVTGMLKEVIMLMKRYIKNAWLLQFIQTTNRKSYTLSIPSTVGIIVSGH